MTSPEILPDDIVLARSGAGGSWLPAGKVERLLPSARGARVLIERAFGRGTYLVAPAADVRDVESPGASGVRWLHLTLPLEALYALGVYGRSAGFLTRLPLAPLPSTIAALDDAHALAALDESVGAEPMASRGHLSLHVRNGVALLEGWIGTVGGKVQVERLARTTPGVWEAFNRILSDEEIGAEVRRALLARPELAQQVAEVRVDLGAVEVVLRSSAPAAAADAQRVRAILASQPGLRSARVRTGTVSATGPPDQPADSHHDVRTVTDR